MLGAWVMVGISERPPTSVMFWETMLSLKHKSSFSEKNYLISSRKVSSYSAASFP